MKILISRNFLYRLNSALILLFLIGCQSISERATGDSGSQLKIRDIQSRSFDNISKNQALRASIATLQDLEFVIDKANYMLGSITATKLSHGIIRISVIVRKNNTGVRIRANARQNKHAITQADVYQNFFTVLDKSIFLVKNDIN